MTNLPAPEDTLRATPGPWTIYDDSDDLKIKIKGQWSDTGGAHVATVLGHANAALIAQAPALKARVEELERELDTMNNNHRSVANLLADTGQERDALRTAIYEIIDATDDLRLANRLKEIERIACAAISTKEAGR